MVADFAAHAERATYRLPAVPFISSVTGAAETDAPASAAYWRDQILATVRFGAAVEALRTAGIDQVLEIGPQATLLGMVARVDGALGRHASLRPSGARDERTQLADATGSLWAAGVAVDWRAVAPAPAAKVDLPTYPFQRQRYWLPEATTAALGSSGPAAPAADQCLYEPQWVPLDAAVPATAPPGAWLVAGGSGAAVAAELRRRGHTVEVVADVDAAVGTWMGVVLTAPAPDDQSGAEPEPVAGQRRRLAPLLSLVQRMLAHEVGLADGGRLWLLTGNGQPVPGSAEPVALTEAPLWGVANAITVEEPNLRVACVDVESVADAAALMVDELLDGGSEDRVALRGDARFGLRLAAASSLAGPDPSGAHGGGTYLITGGLGVLGLHAARTLAAGGATHLALLGRRAPSEPAEQAITELREAGVAVTVFAGDVADAELVETVVADIRATMGPLRGVIHAAGVLDDGTLRNLDWPRFEAVLRPKVAGAWNLHRATLADPLDVFVLYSSAAALLGASGQANYVAANAFLDALAHHRRAIGRPALSINWGAWDEAGMAARLDDGQRSSADPDRRGPDRPRPRRPPAGPAPGRPGGPGGRHPGRLARGGAPLAGGHAAAVLRRSGPGRRAGRARRDGHARWPHRRAGRPRRRGARRARPPARSRRHRHGAGAGGHVGPRGRARFHRAGYGLSDGGGPVQSAAVVDGRGPGVDRGLRVAHARRAQWSPGARPARDPERRRWR